MAPTEAVMATAEKIKQIAAGKFDVWWSDYYNKTVIPGQLCVCSYPADLPFYQVGDNLPYMPFLVLEIEDVVVMEHPRTHHRIVVDDNAVMLAFLESVSGLHRR